MAEVIKTQDENNNPVFEVNAELEDSLTLATANTYVDKNIVFNVNVEAIKTINGQTPDENGDIAVLTGLQAITYKPFISNIIYGEE